MTIQEDDDDSLMFEWTPFYEVHLIYAMGASRFLGMNHHIKLSKVVSNFYASIGNGTGITHHEIIRKIKTYYNLDREKKITDGPYPSVPFTLRPDLLAEASARLTEDSTDDSSVGSKSESETYSNSGGDVATADSVTTSSKRGSTSKHSKKESIGVSSRRQGTSSSFFDSKKKYESTSSSGRYKDTDTGKKTSVSKKRSAPSPKNEPSSKKSKI